MERELDRTRAAVRSLRRLLQPEPAALAVELRPVPAQQVTAVQDTVDLGNVLHWYADAMAALRGALDTGPPGGVYANELFTDGRGHVLVYRQVAQVADDAPPRGRVEPV